MKTIDRIYPALRAASIAAKFLRSFRKKRGPIVSGDRKQDGTLVTVADKTFSRIIRDVLQRSDPGVFILDEETAEMHTRERPDDFWIVDPIDGTVPFSEGGNNFSVLIAYVENGIPVIGVLEMPMLRETFCAVVGGGARYIPPGAKPIDIAFPAQPRRQHARVMIPEASRSQRIYESMAQCCSPSVEPMRLPDLCLANKHRSLLLGKTDLVPTRALKDGEPGGPSVWDVAATNAILRVAGGKLTDLYGDPIDYRSGLKLTRGSLASSCPEIHDRSIARLQPLLPDTRGA